MSTKSNIPQQLKKLRKSLGLTQQQFADKVKISRSLLSQIEGGRSGLTLDRALEICQIINISIDELTGITIAANHKSSILQLAATPTTTTMGTPNDRLKQFRTEMHMSQKDFASKMGLQPSYYTEFESGKRPITVRIVETVKKLYNLSADWVLYGIDNTIANKPAARQITVVMSAEGMSIAKGDLTPAEALEMLGMAIKCIELQGANGL